MVQKTTKRNKILKIYFEHPHRSFTVREISKLTKIPTSTVQRYLVHLKQEKIIDNKNMANLTTYFKFLKSSAIIDKIYRSGLLEYLDEVLLPSTIILFGGVRKGEYVKESDIDLFIASTKRKKLDVTRFERKIGHNLDLFIEKDICDLPPRLLNNVVNGIKLQGYFKVK
jgi:predicted nucleotidyltransferase